jgi:cell division transport system permease protein
MGAAPGVEDVRYDRRWLERLTTASSLVRGVGAAFAFMLIVAASLTVANVVRLSCHARRTELEIMHLVGAPLSFVRGPFIAEGVLQGAFGALVAVTALAAGFLLVPMRLGQVTGSSGTNAIVFLSPAWIGGLLFGGMIVGCLGGVLGVRGARTSPAVATREKEKTETIALEDD